MDEDEWLSSNGRDRPPFRAIILVRVRGIVGRLIDDHAATYLRENKIFTREETRGRLLATRAFSAHCPCTILATYFWRTSIAIYNDFALSNLTDIQGEFNYTFVYYGLGVTEKWMDFFSFLHISTNNHRHLGRAKSRNIITRWIFFSTREFQHFRYRKENRAFKHTVINTRWLYIFRAINLFDATPTFATFIDSPSRHRETGHVIFIKLLDFLGRESVNRERSFACYFPRASRIPARNKEKRRYTEKTSTGVKITSESAPVVSERLHNCWIDFDTRHKCLENALRARHTRFMLSGKILGDDNVRHISSRNNGAFYSTTFYHYHVIPTIYQCAEC